MKAVFTGLGRTQIPDGNFGQPFAGFDQTVLDHAIVGAIAAAGGTFDLPGPAVGYTHRVYDQFLITSSTLAAPFTAPGISGAYNAVDTTVSGLTGATSIGPNPVILASGETFRVTNGSAAVAGRVWAPYYDVYAPSWTVIRETVLATAKDIIPAPPAGFARCLVCAGSSGGAFRNVISRNNIYNADNVAHVFEFLRGADLIQRTVSIAAAGPNISITGGIVVTAATGAYRVRTAEAISATPPNIFLIYETFEI